MAIGKRVIFGKNRNRRTAGPTAFRAKRGCKSGDSGLDLQPEGGRSFGKLFGGKMFFKLEFGTSVNRTVYRDRRFAKIVDRAADDLMRFHAGSSPMRNSTGVASES